MQLGEPQRVADVHARDVDLEVLRDLERQRLDVDLVRHLREHAALLHAGRLADERDRDGGLDRPVETNLLQIDVRDPPADGIQLVLLQHRGVRLTAVAAEDDVQHRVRPGRAGERVAEVAFRNRDRNGGLAPVENAGDQPAPAQATRLGRAEQLPLLDRQLDPLSGHGGGF